MNLYENQLAGVASLELPWEKLSGKNILVTGATGLIGGTFVDVLMRREKRDYTVYALGRNVGRAQKRFGNYWNDPCFVFLEQDIVHPLQGQLDFQYIIHAASAATPAAFSQCPVEVMKANLWGSDNLLSYGVGHGLETFLFISSGEVYGEGDGRAFTEESSGYVDCASVRACYPSSKRAAETLCVSYSAEYNADVRIARLCHTYGPHFTESDDRAYSQFIRCILSDQDIVMKSEGRQFRSWCYVLDCVSALCYILLKGEAAQAYNVANSSSNVTIRELAEKIAVLGNKKVVIECSEQGGRPIVTKAVFDTHKLEALGWKALYNLEEGLSATISELKMEGK